MLLTIYQNMPFAWSHLFPYKSSNMGDKVHLINISFINKETEAQNPTSY